MHTSALLGLPVALCLAAAAASAQSDAKKSQDPNDPALVHVRMFKKIAPSVVYVQGGSKKGTGVIVDKDGYLVTSPTACGETTTEVQVQMGVKRVVGKVIGRMNELELVVIKLPTKGHPAVEMGDSDKAKVGSVTYAFGDSFQSMELDGQPSMSLGTLSAVYEVKTRQRGTLYAGAVLETSAAVNPDQDGGPLIDARGKLIGIISLNYEDSRFTGIAVPVSRLKSHIERMINEDREGVASKPPDRTEPVAKKDSGWLGADVEEDDEVGGVVVVRLFKNGPGDRGGLRKGDVIAQISRQRVMTRKRFDELLGKYEEGTSLTLKVKRDGKEVDVTVTLGKKVYY